MARKWLLLSDEMRPQSTDRRGLARAREKSEAWSEPDPAFEALRNDMIVYLACRLDAPPDAVLTRLGDWLVDPVSEDCRQLCDGQLFAAGDPRLTGRRLP